MERSRSELYIDGEKHGKDTAAMAFVTVFVIVAGVIVWSWLAKAEWSEGYGAGYEQACADVRTSIAMKMQDVEPFEIGRTGVYLSPAAAASRKFFVYISGPAKQAAPAGLLARGESSGQ